MPAQRVVLRTDLPILERGWTTSIARNLQRDFDSGSAGSSSSSSSSSGDEATPATAEEMKAKPFGKWLEAWWRSPESSDTRARMLTDEQYFLLLDACSPGAVVGSMPIDDAKKRWIHHKRSTHNYSVVDMCYHRHESIGDQYGRVLVANARGKKAKRVASTTPLRVISYSQIEAALEQVHANKSGHRGQELTSEYVKQTYEGITRHLVREYVARCPVCQHKRQKQFKAPLQPIITRRMHERFLIDLIDMSTQPDGAYRYIVHMADHRTRFHWAAPIKDKTAASVAAFLETVFSMTGGGLILQSDNGGEFKGEVSGVCERFQVRQVFSSPHHPQTNGLIEKAGHSIKVMGEKQKFIKGTNCWAASVPLSVFQLNTTYSRVIGCTPYELVFGHPFRTEGVPLSVIDPSYLAWLDNQDGVPMDDPQLRSSAEPARSAADPASTSSAAHVIEDAELVTGFAAYRRGLESGRQVVERMDDLAFGDTDDVGRLTAAMLCVCGLIWRRFGTIGGGRCGWAAVVLAIRNCRWEESKTPTQRRRLLEEQSDLVRSQCRDMVSNWRPADKTKWLQAMIDSGAFETANNAQTRDEARTEALAKLLLDLSAPDASMGWELLVVAHVKFRVNAFVLPIVCTNETWLTEDGELEERTPHRPGDVPELISTELVLAPAFFDDSLPCIVLLHRSTVTHVHRFGERDRVDSGGGHYEVLYCSEQDGSRTSLIPPSHAAHALLRRIARDRLSERTMTAARDAMVKWHDRDVHVREFKEGEAVGVRTNINERVKRAKKRGVNNLPGLIVEVVNRGQANHSLYRCLTEYGLIDHALKASDLVDITEGNHPELYTCLRAQLAAAKSRNDTIRTAFPRLTIQAALMASLEERMPAPNRPRREQPPRDPVAAAAAGASARTARQHMVKIVQERNNRYLVQWSLPEAAPERAWEPKTKMDTRAEWKNLVLDWRARQVAAAGQGNEDDDGFDEDSEDVEEVAQDTDSDMSSERLERSRA